MTELKVDNITNLAGSGKPNLPVAPTVGSNAAISTLNTHSYTSSGTEPSSPKNGALWWDSANDKVMVYINGEFKEIELNASAATGNAWSGDRGIVTGGETPTISRSNVIQYFDITTAGNSQDFGDLTVTRELTQGASSSARGLTMGGQGGTNVIDYITIATPGNAIDFGDLNTGVFYCTACSDGTKAFVNGGWSGPINEIQYVTIATTGNAADWGDLTGTMWLNASCSDLTRAVVHGGLEGSSTYLNKIDYYSTASAGNASDFGDGTTTRGQSGACADATRGLFGGGTPDGATTRIKTIDYVTIQTLGNAADFGDLSGNRMRVSACPNETRGAFCGGDTAGNGSGKLNIIEYVTIQTLGNATDLGDLLETIHNHTAFSGNPS